MMDFFLPHISLVCSRTSQKWNHILHSILFYLQNKLISSPTPLQDREDLGVFSFHGFRKQGVCLLSKKTRVLWVIGPHVEKMLPIS